MSKINPDGFLIKTSNGFNFADWIWTLSNTRRWTTNIEPFHSFFQGFGYRCVITIQLPFSQHPFCRTSLMMLFSLLCSACSFPEKLLKLQLGSYFWHHKQMWNDLPIFFSCQGIVISMNLIFFSVFGTSVQTEFPEIKLESLIYAK